MSALLDRYEERLIAEEKVRVMRRFANLLIEQGFTASHDLFMTSGVIEEAFRGDVPPMGTYLELAVDQIGQPFIVRDGEKLDIVDFAKGKAGDTAYTGGWPSLVSAFDPDRRRHGSPKLVGSYGEPGKARINSCSGFWGQLDLAVSAFAWRVGEEIAGLVTAGFTLSFLLDRLLKASTRAEYLEILKGN